MKIEFSGHSLNQLKRRRITQKMVIEALSEPIRYLPSYRDRTLIRSRFGAKIMEIVARLENNKLVIITAYFLKNES